jgi:hypothetical protein
MSLWEYKIITSGKGGFASPALLEKFLNDLGREEWEIVEFHTQPDNFLVFTGMARRPTQRDWTLEDAAAAAAKAEADKLRAEFEAKFKAATGNGPSPEEAAANFLEEKVAPEDGFRKPIDTSHDADADEEETKEEDDWDSLTIDEDELPTFFDAIKPHMRRNQRGPGMSVGVDYLAKKWDQTEDDMKGALVECGFTIPEDEDAKPEYLEFEGDLYWINVNRRGELWINTKEKPRPVFRAVKAQKAHVEEEQKPERKHHEPKHEHAKPAPAEAATDTAGAAVAPAAAQPEEPTAPAELPTGPALLDRIRPMMRRNRRGPGGSGSASFLSRALKVKEADLVGAFKSLGLVVPASANEKPTNVEIGNGIWWINVDSRGGIWINGREKRQGETVSAVADQASEAIATQPADALPAAAGSVAPEPGAPAEVPMEAAAASGGPEGVPVPEVAPAATVEAGVPYAPPEGAPSAASESAAATTPSETTAGEQSAPGRAAAPAAAGLEDIRPLLKESRTGAFANKIDRLAEKLGRSDDELIAALVAGGLSVPEKPREKPVYVERGGEVFWLNRNARGELWLNAKPAHEASKKAEGDEGEREAESTGSEGEKKTRRPRSRKKSE